MTTNSISVVLAIYGNSKFLSKQIDSIKAQTIQPYEIVVVVDAHPTENLTRCRLERILSPLNSKILFNEVNIGPSASFAKGIQSTNGEMVVFCDQDDVWFDFKLEVLAKHFQKGSICYHQGIVFYEGESRRHKLYVGLNRLSLIRLLYKNHIIGATLCCDGPWLRSVIGESSLYPMHDWVIAVIAKLHSMKIIFIDEALFEYRRHSETVTKLKGGLQIMKAVRFRIDLLRTILKLR